MTFKDLRRLLNERKRREQDNNSIDTEIDPEFQEGKLLLQQLEHNYRIAHQQREKKWFAEHPGQQYLNETYEEFITDCTLDEWFWYFIERVTSRIVEQRYEDERNPSYGWNHLSEIHTIEEDCKEGCRFWPEEGRIEDIEVLENYKEHQDYETVRRIWEEIQPPN